MLIAHRGESHLAPENTLAAIELAWSRGSRAVEIDVRLTRDERLVLCHDADTQRTAGQALIVREHASEQLCTLDVGRWKGDRWVAERLPTLEQALATVPEGGRLFIEIKDGADAVPPLVRAIAETGVRSEQCVVISFHEPVIAAAKEALPGVEAAWLTDPRRDEASGRWEPDAEGIVATARRTGADGVDVKACDFVDAALVARLHKAGLRVYVWTVDDPTRARGFLRAGVDGVTTNRPSWMAERLA